MIQISAAPCAVFLLGVSGSVGLSLWLSCRLLWHGRWLVAPSCPAEIQLPLVYRDRDQKKGVSYRDRDQKKGVSFSYRDRDPEAMDLVKQLLKFCFFFG